MFRVPQILCLSPLPGVRLRLLFLALRYGRCFRRRPVHIAWYPHLRRVKDCLSLPLRVATLPLWLSCSDVPGPHVLLSYYVARVISCGPGVLSSLSPFLGCLSGFSELDWGSVEPLRTYEVRFADSGCTLHTGLSLGGALWVFHAMSFSGSLSRSGGGVSLAFVTGFVVMTQAPPLLLGSRVSLYRPEQRETIATGDCYILCGWSGVTWSAWAAHRQRCERFLFAAGCSMKELSKTTVSFWLRMLLSRVCWLSVTERSVSCPLSSVRSCYCSVSSL